MQVIRKFISVIISVALLLTFVPIGVAASEEIIINEIDVKFPGDIVTVSGTAGFDRVGVKVLRPNVTLYDVDSVEVISGEYSYSFEITTEGAPFGTYTVVVGYGEKTAKTTFEFRDFSSDATLSDITIDGKTIEGFSTDTYQYIVRLPFGTSVPPRVEAQTTDAMASLSLNQATTVAIYDVDPTDSDTATIVVTAQDGVGTETYTITFVETPVSIDPISPKSIGQSVTVSGNARLDRVTIKVIRPDEAMIDIDSIEVVDGSYSYTFIIPPDVPVGTYSIVVGKLDYVDVATFEVTDAVQAEKVNVTSDSDEITTNKGTMQMYAVVEGVGGAPIEQDVVWSVEAGTGSALINEDGLLTALTNGTVTVRATSVVTPSVAGTKVISISNQITDGLTSLTITPGELEFDPQVLEYNVVVPADADHLTITPVAALGASVKVNGEVLTDASVQVSLNPGNNVVTVLVEETGKLSMTYTINVKRMSFQVEDPSIDTTVGVRAQATIAPVSGGNAVVVFKLMQGTTPIGLVSITDTINEAKTYTALFPGYAGEGFSVRVFVWDSLTNDVGHIGEDLADPFTIQ